MRSSLCSYGRSGAIFAVFLATVLLTGCGDSTESKPSSATATTAKTPAGYTEAKAACDQYPALVVEYQKLFNARVPNDIGGSDARTKIPTAQEVTIIGSMLAHITKAAQANSTYNDLGNAIAGFKQSVDDSNGLDAVNSDNIRNICREAVPAFGFGSSAQQ